MRTSLALSEVMTFYSLYRVWFLRMLYFIKRVGTNFTFVPIVVPEKKKNEGSSLYVPRENIPRVLSISAFEAYHWIVEQT